MIRISRRRGLQGVLAAAALPLGSAKAADQTTAGADMGNADKTILTPPGWTWQEEHGFVQGRAIPAASRTVYVAGQASMDDKGNPVHKGNMEAQIIQAFGNLETVVAQAGGSLSNVVKVTFFTTDIEAFFAAEKALVQHLTQRDCHPTSTLVEIARLAHPDLLFEVEAIAVV